MARLRALYDDGADLIAVSGGKAFRGPQASGILCGRPELIRHVALHHLDMDLRDSTWNASDITGYWPTGGREGIGRGMKVGREQIVGLLTAVREFASDPDRWTPHYVAELAACERALAPSHTLRVSGGHDHVMEIPTLVIDFSQSPMAADDVARQLDRGSPRIQLVEAQAWRNRLILNPMALADGDGARIGEQILAVLEAGPDHK
jgi:L-seryl-tRNA(Ser) seleniumtransferase